MGLKDGQMVYRGPVSGLSHNDYAKVINKLVVGAKLSLRPVTNMYDSRAVGVFLGNYQVGWIPKAQNAKVSELVRDQGRTLVATVTNHNTDQSFETRLYINVFLEGGDDNEGFIESKQAPNITKESKMTTMNKLIETNKSSAVSAAFLEAGHIANKQYVDTAVAAAGGVTYAGLTPTTYDGNLGGIKGAYAKCAIAFPGSRMATGSEAIKLAGSITGSGWVNCDSFGYYWDSY